MTYFGFLLRFLLPVLAILAVVAVYDARRRASLPQDLNTWPCSFVIGGHMLVALIYTTPWDNYLVATGVWWYDPVLVSGIVLGWVPLEEYLFFVLQTLATGLWLLHLAKRIGPSSRTFTAWTGVRVWTSAPVAILLAVAIAILWAGWRSGTYLALALLWALPPILLQVALGADILWHHRRLVATAILTTTTYFAMADSLAIGRGTWTIDPSQSTGVVLGILPVEELLFFLLTNTLVVFGIILVLAKQSQHRIPSSITALLRRTANRFPVRRFSRV